VRPGTPLPEKPSAPCRAPELTQELRDAKLEVGGHVVWLGVIVVMRGGLLCIALSPPPSSPLVHALEPVSVHAHTPPSRHTCGTVRLFRPANEVMPFLPNLLSCELFSPPLPPPCRVGVLCVVFLFAEAPCHWHSVLRQAVLL
jgi:hypothetical protein